MAMLPYYCWNSSWFMVHLMLAGGAEYQKVTLIILLLIACSHFRILLLIYLEKRNKVYDT